MAPSTRWGGVALVAGLMLVQLWFAPWPVVVVIIGSVPCLAYGIPVRSGRLRDLPGVKPWFVAVLFSLVLCNVCFFDLRDRGATPARECARFRCASVWREQEPCASPFAL